MCNMNCCMKFKLQTPRSSDVRKLVRAVGGDKAWKTWPASLQRGLLLERWNAIDDYQADYSPMCGATQRVLQTFGPIE